MVRLILILITLMPLVASILCIVNGPIWVGILGIIGTIILMILAFSDRQTNIINASKIAGTVTQTTIHN